MSEDAYSHTSACFRLFAELRLSSSQRCKYKEERLGQEVLREERLNRRTRLFKAEVC